MDPTPLLDRAEVANYLGIPNRTLDTWRRRDYGPKAIKVGRHLRWRRTDVDQWLQAQLAREGANDAA